MKYPPVSIKEFFETCAKIEGNPIEIYDYQNELFSCNGDYRIVNKARQIGISTAIAMEALYKAIWFPHTTILFVSTGDRASRELMKKLKLLLSSMENFEFEIKTEGGIKYITNITTADTKTIIELKNKSRVMSLPNNPDTVRGFKADEVYIDEHAHFENPKEIWEAVLPSITRGGKITIVSTPRGKVGEFWRLWDESQRGENQFIRFKFPKDRVKIPKILEKIDENKKVMSELQFKQEYECEFLDEAISMFPYELINPCVKKKIESIYNIRTLNPIYVGIDFGALRSSTVIIIAEKHEKKWIIRPPIKEFLGRKRTMGEETEADYRPQLNYIGNLIFSIKPTRVFVDSTGYGLKLLDELRVKYGGLVQGITFTNPLKESYIFSLRILFENKQIEIPDNKYLIDQLHSLVKSVTRGGYQRFKHSYGKFDDYVWALCLAVSPQASKSGVFKAIARKR